MPDALKNFAVSLVATAPSPATSGTSLAVTAGTGALFPVAPFYATCWPSGVQPTSANAEIVRVTAVSTDTFTITRTQDGSTNQSIAVGWQIQQGVTAGLLEQFAPLASPAFTGTPTAPTPTAGDNTTKVATTAFVDTAVAGASGAVSSVFTRTGAVVADKGDYNATQIPNVALNYTSMPACTVTSIDEWDSAATPVRRWWGSLTASKVVNAGDTFSIALGSYTKTLS